MKSLRTDVETQARGHIPAATPRAESTRDVLDVLTRSIVKTDAREAMPESSLCIAEVNNQPSRELLTEKMLADR